MMSLTRIGLSLCVLSVLFVSLVTGSAWLQDPPSRSAAWFYQIKAPVNYNFRNLDCGGVPVKINVDGSRNCGLCGDPAWETPPRPNENGGKYANPIIRTRYYEEGQKAELSIWNNLPGSPGFYEFRLCADGLNPSQACMNENLLTILDNNKTNMPVPKTQGFNMVHVQLPAGVTCDYCILQWRFRKDNSVEGCDGNNWCGVGRGPQIEYYNCADVTIGTVGQPKPRYIKDPVYSDADYGSAYDVSTTLTTSGGRIDTTPDSGGLDGSTTPRATTNIPILTIPTLPPFFPTQSPVSPPVTTERLVVDGSGNQIGTVLSSSSTSTGGGGGNNNGRLLLLLGLLPLLGAAALRNNNRAPALPIPAGGQSGFWAPNPPLANYYLGNSIGFGNFGPGGFPATFGAPVGFPAGGFLPGAAVAPGRFGRSVSEYIPSGSHGSQTNSVVQFDINGDDNNQTPNSNALKDFAFENRELTAGLSDHVTHVHPRSVHADIDDDPLDNTSHLDDDESSFVRHTRQTGNEYGHADDPTEYGNTNTNNNNMQGRWNPAQTGNRATMMQNGAGFQPPTQQTNLPRPRGNIGKILMQRRRMRNQGLQTQNPDNGGGRLIADVNRFKQPDDRISADFEGLMNNLDKKRGFFASRNPLAMNLFGRKRPSAHDWYQKLMATSSPLNPNTK